jgi:hypothetical protein
VHERREVGRIFDDVRPGVAEVGALEALVEGRDVEGARVPEIGRDRLDPGVGREDILEGVAAVDAAEGVARADEDDPRVSRFSGWGDGERIDGAEIMSARGGRPVLAAVLAAVEDISKSSLAAYRTPGRPGSTARCSICPSRPLAARWNDAPPSSLLYTRPEAIQRVEGVCGSRTTSEIHVELGPKCVQRSTPAEAGAAASRRRGRSRSRRRAILDPRASMASSVQIIGNKTQERIRKTTRKVFLTGHRISTFWTSVPSPTSANQSTSSCTRPMRTS